ncbi:MAG TPA: alpha/beta hydrolase [Candidatus Eremiobacteraceae bacterium]|nr:alpha/beta hydrolase [Candidatus Eremiobacteraceae bacterium]
MIFVARMRVHLPFAFLAAQIVWLTSAVPSAAAPGDTVYAVPGLRVDAGGHGLNLYCMGSGRPAVVFDSGWEDWAPAWAFVQPAVSRWTRTCTYDRAGSGFSDAGPLPRTSVQIADELHAALHAAGVTGPYILVGHSFGSYNTRAFADRYMSEVAGLVLVDGEDGDVEPASDRHSDDSSLAGFAGQLIRCGRAVAVHAALPALQLGMGKTIPCDRQFFRGLPEKTWSPQLNAAVLHIVATRTTLYNAVVSELLEMPWDEVYLISHLRSFGSRPVRVLTAQNHYYDTAATPARVHQRHLADEREEARNQARWLTLSSNSKQIFAYQSGHYIELDQPELVIAAIHDVLTESRNER